MKHMHTTVIAAFFIASAAGATNQYVRDDGTANLSLGYGLPEDYCWMHWFDAVGGADTITSIQACIPASTPAGTPITFCVWDDPTDDGDPYDCILVSRTTTTVQSGAVNVFRNYPLLAPAPVQGRFFVGAFVTEDGSLSPAALDTSTNPHAAYFATAMAGTFDPAQLANYGPTHIETVSQLFHGAFLLRAEGGTGLPQAYCAAKVNSLGCMPAIGAIGIPSASATTGCVLFASNVRNRQNGLLYYGTTGRALAPFLGGTQCVAAPLRRTGVQASGGNLSTIDCSGTYVIDFNAWIASGVDPLLVAGTTVNAQYYSRDGGFAPPENVGLTDAIEFTIAP